MPSRTSRWQFFRTWLRDRRVASVTPTSGVAVRRICRCLEFCRPLTIVELGPGSGAFTRYLLSHLSSNSRVFAFELNVAFAATLRALGDPRLTVVNDSAERLSEIAARQGWPRADAVISGIPFSFFSGVRQEGIMRQVASILKPGGVFIVYQFSPQVGAHLRAAFSRVEQFRLWRNLPPLVVYYARSS